MRFLCATICAAFFTAAQQGALASDVDDADTGWRQTASDEGGLIFLMRHTDKVTSGSPREAPPADYQGACTLKAGLTAPGEARAKAVGADFSTRLPKVAFAESFSSSLCRTAHTAHYASGDEKPDESSAITTGHPYDKITEAEAETALNFRQNLDKAALAAGADGKNILVAIHSDWIETLLDDDISIRTIVGTVGAEPWPMSQCFGEVRIFRPTATGWLQMGRYSEHVSFDAHGKCVSD